MWNDVRTSASLMKRAAFLVIVFLAACSREPQRAAAKPSEQPVAKAEMQTIDSTDSRPVALQPPPVLPDEAPAPKPLNLAPNQEVPVLGTQDERVRAQLPFAPAIALDPIDGLKVSIRAST